VGSATLEIVPVEGEVSLSLSKTCAPVISVNVELSVLQKTRSEVGRVAEVIAIAAQSKLRVPAVLPVKLSSKSTATASGVALEPVERNCIA
jgi:hypothetical protein